MNLFGKKKEEEIEEEELDQAEQAKLDLENKRLKKKLKDLAPENKKNRKEPPKPWGKKERLIVGSFFLITTLAAAVLFLVSHEFKFPGLPKITLKGFSLDNPFGEKVIELGQKKSAPVDDRKADNAVEMFNRETKPLGGVYGFEAIRLDTGDSYGVSRDSQFQGASLLKLPLMVLAFKKSEEGGLDLETKYILKEEDKVVGSGVLYTAKPGTEYSYRELIKHMGKESDRTAYKVMKGVIGETEFKNFLTTIGATHTDITSGMTTPSDLGMLFQKTWDGSLLSESDTQELLGYLTNTIYENWITAGVPKGITVAHKYGQDNGVLADGGIIESPNPYILIIMGQGITKQEADILFPKISKNIYNIENDVQ